MAQDHQRPVAQSERAPSRRLRRGPAIILVCGAAALTMILAEGCGSSSKKPTASVAAAPAQGPSATATSVAAARPRRTAKKQQARTAKAAPRSAASRARQRRAAPRITHGKHVQRPEPGTGGNSINDDNPAALASRADSGPSTAGAPNPCALVAQARVQTFTGKRLAAPKEAPLGPTCIYQELGAHAATVTVVVESLVFSSLKAHVKKVSQFEVGGRVAYCGVYGAPTTFVPLPRKRVLSITASCAVGAKFAAAAVPKLVG